MSRPWMPLYVADYVADTMHLSRANRGSYMSLICHYWRHGGLPTDLALLQQIAGTTPEEWNTDGAVLAAFFTISNNVWVHKRIEKELQDSENKYEKRRASGKLGGEKKASNASSNAKAKSYQPQPHIEGSKDPSNSCRKQVSTGGSATRFYAAYPKHVGPENSARAFEKRLKQGVDPEHIISAAIRFAEANTKAGTEKKYIPAPAVWLNGGRYDDQDLPQPYRMNGNGHDPPITAYTRPSMGPVIQDLERKAAESRAKADRSRAEFEQWKKENE